MITVLKYEGEQAILRAPLLGDTYAPRLNIMHKITMDNQIWAVARPTNTTIQTLNFNFMTRVDAVSLENFLKITAGKEITLQKQSNDGDMLESWVGKITNYPHETVHEGRANSVITIVFEGIRDA